LVDLDLVNPLVSFRQLRFELILHAVLVLGELVLPPLKLIEHDHPLLDLDLQIFAHADSILDLLIGDV
jgi:hypothetical protein